MDYQKVLGTLMEQGKVTQEDIEEAEKAPDVETIREIAHSLHLILCTADHDWDTCRFPQEEQMVDPWDQPSHQKWYEYTADMMGRVGVNEKEIVNEILYYLPTVVNQIETYLSEFGLRVLQLRLNKIYSNYEIT